MHAIGDGAGGDAADQDIDAGMQHRHQRKQRDPEHQRQHVRYLPAVARGRKQERQRRQQQDRRRKQRRQVGGKAIAERGGDHADGDKPAAEPMRERNPPLARHLRQQPVAFDPQRDGDEMRRQHQMTTLRLRRLHQRQHRHHHRKQPDRAHRHRNRRLHRGRAGPQRRNQDDLRRARPDQQRAAEHPAQAEMAVMGQRADAEIGRKQHQRQHRGCDRAHAPCEGAQGALPAGGRERR